MQVRVKKLHPDAVIPSYANAGDAGMDMVAISSKISDDGLYVEYGTGIAVEIPAGYVGLLFARSSISKTTMVLANHVGVIDSGYRGEIKFRFKDLGISLDQEKWYCDETAYEVGQSVTDSTSSATGTIKHVVTLATDTTTNYTWVRLYLEDVSGVFGSGNTITSTTSGGDPVTGIIPSDITDETNMLAASLPLILRPDAIVAASAGNIVTLPYTQAVYAENPYASEAINTTNKLLFTYEGTIELTPASDPWFDEENAPEGDSFTLPNTGSTTWFASVAAPPRAAAPASSGTSSTGTPVSDSGTSYTSSGFGGTGSAGQQYYYNPSTGAYEPDYSNQQFINVQ